MDLGINGLEDATQIGSGASAVVYQARQRDLGRDVAVKVLSSNDEDFVRRFKREARTLGKLSQNSGIVTVYDFGETANGQPYLVLELCSTSLLEQVKSSGPLEPRDACAALADVCDAVGEAHDIGVVHRDIKPGNILISPNGRYLITDFGISTVSGATMGQTSTVGFTAGYAAPETFQSGESGPPTDVYALGATLFHLVVGTPPFIDPEGDTNLLAVLHRVSTEPVPDLRPTGVPDSVCQVIEACMAKESKDRPTVQQLAEQLRHIKDTGELAFPISDPHNGANRSTWGESEPVDPDSTRAMTAAMGISGRGQSQGAGAAGPEFPASPQPKQVLPKTLAPNEQQYQPRGEPERSRSSRGPVAVLMLLAFVLIGGVLAVNLLPGSGDANADGQTIESSDNPDSEVVASGSDEEISAEIFEGQEEDPSAPTTDQANIDQGTVNIIPDTKGSSERQAAATLQNAGFRSRVEYISSTSVPEGTVIRSSPRAGQEEPTSTLVVLIVSSGSETFTVDNVVGKSESAAVNTLTTSGFSPEVVTESSATIAEGTVIRTDPAAGQKIGKGATVSVVVSSGPDGCTGSEVPNVVGESELVATGRIEDSGLVATVSEQLSSSVNAGNVISSNPSATDCLEANSTVNLVVACKSAEVPDIAGQDGTDLATLINAGFTPEVTEVEDATVTPGEVISTTPAGGVIACTSLPVIVKISKAVGCSVAVPNLAGMTRADADAELASKNLTGAYVPTPSPTVAAGIVISSNPAAATIVCPNTSVDVQISSGTACVKIPVPEVEGLQVTAALTKLNADFAPTEVRQTNNAPVDEVIETVPPGGTLACPGDPIRVIVSKGPTTTTTNPNLTLVPSVETLTYGSAVARLQGAGFDMIQRQDRLVASGSTQVGKVIVQNPPAGTRHDPAIKTVILTVGDAAGD